MSEKTQITDKYPTSSPQTRLDTGDCVVHYTNENNSTQLCSPLSVTAVLAAWRSWRLQSHIHWTNLTSSSSVFTLCFQAQHVTSEPQKTKYPASTQALCGSLRIARICFILFRVPQPFQKIRHSIYWPCGHNKRQIYMSSDSVIRNWLLYQLCTRELLWHWHFHYWRLDVLGIGRGFTVADASCLWDHSFDPYSFTALYRAESKFLLLILSFELQKQQPAGRRKKTNSILQTFCAKEYRPPVLVDSFLCFAIIFIAPLGTMFYSAQHPTCK